MKVTVRRGRHPGRHKPVRKRAVGRTPTKRTTTSIGPTTGRGRENLQEVLRRAREASPAGTLGGATGRAGVKGTAQATGAGRTQLVVEKETLRTAIVKAGPRAAKTLGLQVIKEKKEPEQLTLRQEIQKSLLERKGFEVEKVGTTLEARKKGRVTVITAGGGVVTAPTREAIKEKFIETPTMQRTRERVRARRLKSQELVTEPATISMLKREAKKPPPPPKTKVEKFEEEVEKFTEAERKFYQAPYFQKTEKIATAFVGGEVTGKRAEQLATFGPFTQVALTYPRKYVKSLVQTTLNIPGGIAGLVLFTPKKAALAGKAIGLGIKEDPEILKATRREFLVGAPTKVVKGFDPREPKGAAALTLVAAFGAVKGAAAMKSGRGPFVGAKADIKTVTYQPKITVLEKTAAVRKYGTIQTVKTPAGKAVLQKPGPVRFVRPRQKLVEKEIGGRTPAVSVSAGKVRIGTQRFTYRSIQVGRKFEGALIGRKFDILFRKTRTGKFRVTKVEKTELSLRGFEPSKTRVIPFSRVSPKITKLTGVKQVFRRQEGIGMKIGETKIFPRIQTRIGTVVKGFGKRDIFRGGRDIKTRFVGRGAFALRQRDIATAMRLAVEVGGKKTLTFRPADIKLALQPKYKPNIRVLTKTGLGKDVQLVKVGLKRPKLYTERVTGGRVVSRVIETRSRVKPIKTLFKITSRLDKRGELRPGPQIKLGSPVTVEAKAPTITLPKTFGAIVPTTKTLVGLLPGKATRIVPIPLPKTKVPVREITRAIPKTKVKTKAIVRPRVDIKLPTKTKAPVIAKIKTPTKTKTPTITKITTVTRTITPTRVRTPTPTPTPPGKPPRTVIPRVPVPPPPPPPPIIFGLPPGRKKKKKKRIQRLMYGRMYQPQLYTAGLRIAGPKPKVLTGLGLRPITNIKF